MHKTPSAGYLKGFGGVTQIDMVQPQFPEDNLAFILKLGFR